MEGTLSIVRYGNTYQVRCASNNPHGMDHQLYTDLSQDTLHKVLHQWGMDPWYITQAMVELRKGGCAVLPMVFSEAQALSPPTRRSEALRSNHTTLSPISRQERMRPCGEDHHERE